MKKALIFVMLMAGFISARSQYTSTKIQVGQHAPDLAYPTPEGKTIRLSEINKGTYVLLDFWASWCGPCRHANPGLVNIYKEYSKKKFKNAKKGFTVVSVSLDKAKENWVAAIKQDNLNWPNHMSDLAFWNSKAAATYGVQSIPQAFLIDPQGKIVGKYQVAEEAEGDIKKFVAE